MALSPLIAAYGNPAEQSAQAMQKKNKVNRLLELERTQGQFDDLAASKNAMPHAGPDYSGYGNEFEYRQGLNRAGEMASLNSQLSGKGPAQVRHTYAGTEFAMGPATQALQRRAGGPEYDGPTDNLDYFGRLADVNSRQIQNERQRNAAFRESTFDDPVFAARRRDIAHADTVDEGAARGEAAAQEYLAHGQRDARRQRLWDDEERQRTLLPFNAAAIRGDAQMGTAGIKADADRYRADTAAGARVGASAIGSLGRLAGAPSFTPEQDQRIEGARGAIQPNVPGQQGLEAPQNGPVFPRNMLGRFAAENGFQSEQQAAEFLQRVHGYRVQ